MDRLNEHNMDTQFLKGLTDAQFGVAKQYFLYVNICRLVVLLANIGIIFSNAEVLSVLAVVSPAIAVISVLMQIRVDRYKSSAEALLRQYEEHEGFGWPVSRKTVSDIMINLPARLRHEASEFNLLQPYYASQAPKSMRRIIENLEESAWWTKHLSSKMASYSLLFVLIMFTSSFFALVFTLNLATNQSFERNMARAAVSVVAFLFTGGMIKLWLDYRQLNEQATRTENTACQLLASAEELNSIDATRLLNEYQIARASSPLIPDWVFKHSQSDLDDMWKKYRSR